MILQDHRIDSALPLSEEKQSMTVFQDCLVSALISYHHDGHQPVASK